MKTHSTRERMNLNGVLPDPTEQPVAIVPQSALWHILEQNDELLTAYRSELERMDGLLEHAYGNASAAHLERQKMGHKMREEITRSQNLIRSAYTSMTASVVAMLLALVLAVDAAGWLLWF